MLYCPAALPHATGCSQDPPPDHLLCLVICPSLQQQAEAEADKPRGASPFRPLLTVALLAAAAGAAIVLGGSGAAAKAPAGKRGSWRNRQ